jgi:DNA modification methylase
VSVQILVGDCRQTLPTLAAGRFHTCVTSPPYWGLRDYGTEPLDWPAISYAPLPGLPPLVEIPAMRCSLGLEPTLEAFIGHQLLVFREVRRVLRDDGTLWVNMGDSYAGSRSGGEWPGSGLGGTQTSHSREAKRAMTASRRRDDEEIPRSDLKVPGLKSKDLLGQPWRLALALQADGWYLRRDVIWHKRNPMPESAKDRPTTAHEYLFLLSKSERYYYDAAAILEPASPETHERYARGRSEHHKHADTALVPGNKPQTIAGGFEHMRKPVGGWASGAGSHTALEHQQADLTRHGKLIDIPTGEAMGRVNNGVGWGYADGDEAKPRTVRKVAQRPDGASEDGKGERMGRGPGWRVKNNADFDAAMRDMRDWRNKRSVWTLSTEGYEGAHFATFPTKLVEPCILAGCPEGGEVLDCFGGSATTGLVADRLGRNAVLCELNPQYASMGEQRVANDRGHVSRQRGIDLEGADA